MSNDTPLKNVSMDTFAIVAAILFTWNRQDMLDQKDWLDALGNSVMLAADLIALVQEFDWEKFKKEMQLPKGEQ